MTKLQVPLTIAISDVDLVGAVREVADDRHGRGGRRFALERRLGALREHAERGELRREQRLVRGDDRLAGGERGDERGLDGIAAGDLDDHVDVGIRDEIERAIGERDAVGERPRGFVDDRAPRSA